VTNLKTDYEVVVVGGGPAGMMAAGRAAECGARVLLIEKNSILGKKLRITGGGRCNIFNAEPDTKKLVAKYGKKGSALLGSFARFGVSDTRAFFEERNLPLKVEAEQRAFPVSEKAEDVVHTMAAYLQAGNVDILSNASVARVRYTKGHISGIQLNDGRIVTACNYILATGGKSQPETGSTGDGFLWLSKLGHTVQESNAALVPITLKESWVKNLSGVSFKNAKLTVFQNGKKKEQRIGKILFTHFGISGPLALNMSKSIADLFVQGPVELFLDLYPEEDLGTLDVRVLTHLGQALNKKIRNGLGGIVPPRMVATVLVLAEIDPEKQANVLTKTERGRLVRLIKALPLTVSGFLGVEKAVVTSGGVSLKEVDFKTMQSKLFKNLYIVGDLLDFDRPSGGYSLQICWTTGFLAGENAAQRGTTRDFPLPHTAVQ